MVNLLSWHEFLFLEFLQRYLLLQCNLLFWLWNNLVLFSGDQFHEAGELMPGLTESWALWVSVHVLGALFTGYIQWLENLHLNPYVQYYSLHWSACAAKNSALSFGHWACVQSHCLAWVHLLIPSLQSHGFFKWHLSDTWWFFRYVHPEGLGSSARVEPLDLRDFAGFCGSSLQVTSGCK